MSDEPHVLRMADELNELARRIDKLALFLTGDTFKALDTEDQELLHEQYEYMLGYSVTLQKRLERAK